MPRLSVLMPARNAGATIDRALRSTLRALPRDAELHVLDDASTDDTAARVEAVGDPRIRLTRTPTNLGVARGLQTLLEATDAEYVGRMDADDVTLPTRFRAEFGALARGADLVFSTFQVIGPSGALLPRVPVPPVAFSPRVGAIALLLDCPYPHSSLLARRATLADAGGYRAAVTEDYDLWLRAASAGARIARIGRPGILLRAHPGSVSAEATFRTRLAADPRVAASYRALAARLLGADAGDAPWYRALRFVRDGPLDAGQRAELTRFSSRFGAALAATGAGPLEHRSLQRRAAQELA